MQNDNYKTLLRYLRQLELTEAESQIFLLLATRGPLTAVQASKQSKLPRTQVYRHIDKLVGLNIANSEKLSYGTLYSALPLKNLEARLEEQALRASKLQKQLPALDSLVKTISGSEHSKETGVKHYYGLAGIKQANWNLTKATSEFRVFEQKHISEHIRDPVFTKRLREKYIENKLKSFDLTNNTKLSLKDTEPLDLSLSKTRHIDQSVIDISFELYIYDSTVTLLDYTPEKMMAVEITNPNLAKMMTQMFDAFWALGKDLTPS